MDRLLVVRHRNVLVQRLVGHAEGEQARILATEPAIELKESLVVREDADLSSGGREGKLWNIAFAAVRASRFLGPSGYKRGSINDWSVGVSGRARRTSRGRGRRRRDDVGPAEATDSVLPRRAGADQLRRRDCRERRCVPDPAREDHRDRGSHGGDLGATATSHEQLPTGRLLMTPTALAGSAHDTIGPLRLCRSGGCQCRYRSCAT